MKLLLVDDNRDHTNWGGRATSIALTRLLSGAGHDVAATVANREVHTVVAVSESPVLRRALRAAPLRRQATFYLEHGVRIRRLLTELGLRDVIGNDPAASAQRLLKHRRDHPLLASLYERVIEADAVVVNGEGSMIFKAQPRRELAFQLAMLALAEALGKPAYYLNAVVSDAPGGVRNAETYAAALRRLERCARVSVRDPHSLELLRASGYFVPASLVPDALFSWYPERLSPAHAKYLAYPQALIPHPENEAHLRWDFSKPYLCVAGSSHAATDQARAEACYGALVESLKVLGLPLYLIESCTGDRFLHRVGARAGVPVIPVATNVFAGGLILAGARALVTGRYHPAILASLGGTPCVFLGSDSHKTRSLQALLGYATREEASAFPTPGDVAQVCERTREALETPTRRGHILQAVTHRAAEARRVAELLDAPTTDRGRPGDALRQDYGTPAPGNPPRDEARDRVRDEVRPEVTP